LKAKNKEPESYHMEVEIEESARKKSPQKEKSGKKSTTGGGPVLFSIGSSREGEERLGGRDAGERG